MTSFGWKRKAGANLISKTSSGVFVSESEAENETDTPYLDWLTSAPKRQAISLEDVQMKSKRLKAEGAVLAESERFWEAIKKWDEAILLTPNDVTIIEMKAQALMAVGEVFPALQVAQRAVDIAPLWWVAHQTLGRALVNRGEVNMALRSFSCAVHLNPADQELWSEDLMWAKSLLEKKKMILDEESKAKTSLKITDVRGLNSVVENEEKTGKNALIKYDNSQCGSCEENDSRTSMKKIPSNYIQMRDPT